MRRLRFETICTRCLKSFCVCVDKEEVPPHIQAKIKSLEEEIWDLKEKIADAKEALS